MIRLQRITTADTDLYSYMEKLMTQSFPSEEYRELEEFGHFYYIEHFAIDPAQRNGGYGKSVLNHLCQLLKHPIVLEVEIPEEEMAKRRINFYQRQGFSLWEKPYQQPPYKTGDNYLPMLIRAYGDIECGKDFDSVKEHIYREVYNVKS